MRLLNSRLQQVRLRAERELHSVSTGKPQKLAHQFPLLLIVRVGPLEAELAACPIHVAPSLLINLGERYDYFVRQPLQSTREPLEVLKMRVGRSL